MSDGLIFLAVASPVVSIMAGILMWIRANRSKLHFEKEMNNKFTEAIGKITTKHYELQRYAENLDNREVVLNRNKSEIEDKINQVIAKGIANEEVRKGIQKDIKRNACELIMVKTSTLYLYDMYREVNDMLLEILDNDEDIDFHLVQEIQDDVCNRISMIDDYFHRTFNMSCDRYKKMERNVVGRSKEGGDNFITEFSKN